MGIGLIPKMAPKVNLKIIMRYLESKKSSRLFAQIL